MSNYYVERQVKACKASKKNVSGNRKTTFLNRQEGEKYSVDYLSRCGYCSFCRATKVREWIVRNYFESQFLKSFYSLTPLFVTLTYADSTDFVNFLNYSHLQKFFKRLRKSLDMRIRFRYHAVGHYGKRTGRAHFHLVLYFYSAIELTSKELKELYKDIDKAWGKGIVDIELCDLKQESITYISLHNSANYPFRRILIRALDYLCLPYDEYNSAIYMQDELFKRYDYVVLSECETYYFCVSDLTARKVKSFINSVKEKILHSKSLGWNGFAKYYFSQDSDLQQQRILQDGVWINGSSYRLPHSWIKKLAALGEINAVRHLLELKTKDIDEQLQERELTSSLYKTKKTARQKKLEKGQKVFDIF